MKENKYLKHKNLINIILSIVITIILCVGAFFAFYKFYLKNLVVEKTIKEVTVTDSGISDAVENVYDATVVVESYINGRLYSTGTGFVYKKDDNYGYILTNSHVIENATEVKIILTSKESITTKVLGNDSYSDIAVLSIPSNKVLSVASVGDSDSIKVGDTAFTVGAPVDASAYSWTVTRGIISGKNREVAVTINNSSSVMEVIQTDAAINSGNSGGPLCNSNGEVIGITNMKLASTNIEGMGFAIPIKTAVQYANKFISGEEISRPFLGVSLYESPNETRTSTRLYIASVESSSPADKAGLKKGDLITKIDDVEVNDATHFKYQLYKHNIGDEVNITIKRNDKEMTIKVKLSNKN